MSFAETTQAFFMLLAFVVTLIVVLVLFRHSSNLISAMTDVFKGFSTKNVLDTVEPVTSKIPAETVVKLNKLIDFAEALAPDDIDKALEAFRLLMNKATDGQPNAPDGGFSPPGTVG